MNRKTRRANLKQAIRAASLASPSPSQTVDSLLANAAGAYQQGDLATAQAICRSLLEREPKHVRALILAGVIAQSGGRNNQAIKLFSQAISIDPQVATAYDGAATAYEALGRHSDAVSHSAQAIALGLVDVEARIKQKASIASALQRLKAAWPRVPGLDEILKSEDEKSISAEPMLLAALRSRPVADVDLERLLTVLRRGLLDHAMAVPRAHDNSEALDLFCSLAQQCFINEYVFAVDQDEATHLLRLRDRVERALADRSDMAPVELVTLSAYVPLHELHHASSLMEKTWPDAIDALITQQVREPLEERTDRSAIPALTLIDNAVSEQVRDQYEENPYPRWISLPRPEQTTLPRYLSESIGIELKGGPAAKDKVEILVAGSGTGSHPIDTALRFPNSNVLAIDISRGSLAYARRKTRELGVSNVEYGQADILNLGAMGRSFDVVETVGVLHHLGDPDAGWRVLVSLLRPGGLMLVGLYSERARREVNAIRHLIAERGYRASAEDIRSLRQDLIRSRRAPNTDEFFSTSGCRDLFFNVMEHQFTIPRIKAFLAANRLSFLGFQLPSDVLDQFRHRFADPSARRDLDAWQSFEEAVPFTFSRMYYFWVQKADAA